MKPGGGKAKGAQFERWVCKQLSLWVTKGEKEDVFWRSAMSGGRATVAHRKGVVVRQAGDITAVAPEGIAFCEKWYVECKHVKRLALDAFFVKKTGPLYKFWRTTVKEVHKHRRQPMLIARQNGWPVIVIVEHNRLISHVDTVVTDYSVAVILFSDMLKVGYNDGTAHW